MYLRTVIEVIKTFSREELYKFKDFLNSPYFSKHKTVITLYEELIKYYPDFNQPDITENLLIIISPALKYSTLYDVVNILEMKTVEFIAHNGLKDGEGYFDLNKNLLESLKQRGFRKLFEKRAIVVQNFINDDLAYAQDFFYRNYVFSNLYLQHLQTGQHIAGSSKLKPEQNYFFDSFFNFINFFVNETVNIYLNNSIYKLNFGNTPETSSVDGLFESINLGSILKNLIKLYPQDVLIGIYTELFLMFKNLRSNKHYFLYKKLIENNKDKISGKEYEIHFSRLIHFSIIKTNNHSSTAIFNKELLTLYNVYLKEKLYTGNNEKYISGGEFRNILLFGINTDNYDWVRALIKNHIDKVAPDERQNMKNYGLAQYNYVTGNYELSIRYLNKVEFDNVFNKIDVKNLFLKNYYELGYYENALSLINAYKIFLKSNKVIGRHIKSGHKKFIEYFEALFRFKAGTSRIDLGYLKTKIKKEGNVLNKGYLIRKIEALESKQEGRRNKGK